MSGNDIIKNPARENDTVEYKKYTPQYLSLGVNPKKVDLAPRENMAVATYEQMSEDNGRLKDYPTDSENLIGDSIPNVGNNTEQLWASIEDDGLNNLNIKNKIHNQYVLVAKEQIIFVGSLSEVEEEIRKIFYEEHETYSKQGITIDDLVVLKKLKIKVGVFLED